MTEPTKFLLITPNMADDKMFMRNLFDIPYLVLNNTLTVDQVISIVPQADNLDLVIAFRSYNSFPLFAEDSNTYFSQKFVDMLNALKTKSATFSVTFMTPDKVPSDALAALTMPTKVVSTQIKQELTLFVLRLILHLHLGEFYLIWRVLHPNVVCWHPRFC